ncbi:hypothetical protein TNCV_3060581 [Trichonephila clavipes]|uniref:Uncharacterized protein n=1 Tax=Trichonephila clavipes TaxID=2585209 RepID=A0A8X7BCR2_TRICX|nr:hypothetical protein TNCV_3060581 [Trichonephila clavipes]
MDHYLHSNVREINHSSSGGLMVWEGVTLDGRIHLYVFERGTVTIVSYSLHRRLSLRIICPNLEYLGILLLTANPTQDSKWSSVKWEYVVLIIFFVENVESHRTPIRFVGTQDSSTQCIYQGYAEECSQGPMGKVCSCRKKNCGKRSISEKAVERVKQSFVRRPRKSTGVAAYELGMSQKTYGKAVSFVIDTTINRVGQVSIYEPLIEVCYIMNGMNWITD